MHSSYFPSSIKFLPTSSASPLDIALVPYFLRRTSGDVFVPSLPTVPEPELFPAADARSPEREPAPPMSELLLDDAEPVLPVDGEELVPVDEVLPDVVPPVPVDATAVDGVELPADVVLPDVVAPLVDGAVPVDADAVDVPVLEFLPPAELPVDDVVPPVDALPLDDEEEPPFVEFSPPNPLPVEETGVTVPLLAFLPPFDEVPPADDVLPVLDASLSPELRTVTDGFEPRPDVLS